MDLFVKTAKNTYYSGETVRIVGILTPPENGSILNFQVYGPNGIPVRYEQVTKSEDGCYYLYFRPENDSDVGEYVVEAKAGDEVAKSSFSYLRGRYGKTITFSKARYAQGSHNTSKFDPPGEFSIRW